MKTLETSEAIRHHLENNIIPPLTDNAVERILTICNDLNEGKLKLGTVLYSKTAVIDLLNDYKIDVI